MHCSKCEARIHEALEKAGIAHAIELEKKYNLQLPIIDTVASIVDGKMSVREAVGKLFARKKQNEIAYL